jgi:hypothetical protein
METEQHVFDLKVKMADWVEFNQTQQKLAKLSWRAFAMPHADFELQARERPQGPLHAGTRDRQQRGRQSTPQRN